MRIKYRYYFIFTPLLIGLAILAAINFDVLFETPAAQRQLPVLLDNTDALLARELPFTRVHNFRDLGGYQTPEGKSVKWGMLYRSSKLSELTSADQQFLQRLELKSVIDFRGEFEKQRDPNQLPADDSMQYIPLPINVAQSTNEEFMQRIIEANESGGDLSDFMVQANRDFVLLFTPVFREFIQLAVDDTRTPMVFHCTAGKDRTGFAAAMLLLALGIPYETVMADYLLSNQYSVEHMRQSVLFIRLISGFQVEASSIEPLFVVERHYLEAAFEEITREYGSIDNYLRDGLGIDASTKHKLREKYLQ